MPSNIEIQSTGWSKYRLTTSVLLPRPRTEVFAFFSDARNLEVLTPEYLNFRILTPLPIEMETGTLIDYKIRLHGVPIRWRTRISAWEPEQRFVDEQLRGPYRRWHHEHTFADQGDSTRMTDVVDYSILFGFLMHPLLVRRDLQTIFNWRRNKILEVFSENCDLGTP